MTTVRIFFDGTVETAGQVLVACLERCRRVHIVVDRGLSQLDVEFLDSLEDCGGSLVERVNGRARPRRTVGSARHCTRPVADGVDAFFRIVADRSEAEVDEVFESLECCHAKTCGVCMRCVNARTTAEAYGVYDLTNVMSELKGRL